MTEPLYGPYLIVQELNRLQIPLRQHPETGLLLHAPSKEKYTQLATRAEAEAMIERDLEARGQCHDGERDSHLQVVLVAGYEAVRERAAKKKKQKAASRGGHTVPAEGAQVFPDQEEEGRPPTLPVHVGGVTLKVRADGAMHEPLKQIPGDYAEKG